MPAQQIAQNLAFINWTVLAGLAIGSFAAVVFARARTEAPRGFLAFTALCAAGFAWLAWLSDGSLATAGGPHATTDPVVEQLRRAGLGALALSALIWAIATRQAMAGRRGPTAASAAGAAAKSATSASAGGVAAPSAMSASATSASAMSASAAASAPAATASADAAPPPAAASAPAAAAPGPSAASAAPGSSAAAAPSATNIRSRAARIASVAGVAGIVGAIVALAAGAYGWANGIASGAPLLIQLVVLSGATGGVFAAMILGHWYLVTPKLGERPLVLLSRLLLWIVGLQLILFVAWLATGAGVGTAPFAALVGPWALFVWLRLVVGLVFPLIVSWAAVQTAKTRSMESATGLLYINVGSIAAGTILASGLYFGAGLLT